MFYWLLLDLLIFWFFNIDGLIGFGILGGIVFIVGGVVVLVGFVFVSCKWILCLKKKKMFMIWLDIIVFK